MVNLINYICLIFLFFLHSCSSAIKNKFPEVPSTVGRMANWTENHFNKKSNESSSSSQSFIDFFVPFAGYVTLAEMGISIFEKIFNYQFAKYNKLIAKIMFTTVALYSKPRFNAINVFNLFNETANKNFLQKSALDNIDARINRLDPKEPDQLHEYYKLMAARNIINADIPPVVNWKNNVNSQVQLIQNLEITTRELIPIENNKK